MKTPLMCFVLFSLISSCALPHIEEPIKIRIKSATLTFAWDPPDINLPGSPIYVSRYRVYYSVYGTSLWNVLGDTPASENPRYTAEHSRLGDGLFAFAVTSLNSKGEESPFHTSLDWTAEPLTGWYVWWVRNE